MIGISRVIALFAFLSLVGAAQGADRYVGRCDVVFKVDSSTHTVTGDITNITLVVYCDTNSAGDAVLNTHIESAPTRLTTHSKKRDAHMYKMFRPDVYPKLVAAVSNAPVAAANLAPGPGFLAGVVDYLRRNPTSPGHDPESPKAA